MNRDLFVWTSDWHLVSSDAESGGSGETHPTDAGAVSAYIASLDPAGVIDTGDCKDHYGLGTSDELDNYQSFVQPVLPYATVGAGFSAQLPILPGNHDEVADYNTLASVTDFSLFDAAFWGAPYHWTCDWTHPKVRFIAFHSYIHHSQDGFAGFGHVDAPELTWLQEQLDALPESWQAIVCSHFPGNIAFGNEIRSNFGGTALRALLAANTDKIAAYLNGHRHGNMETNVLDGITHFNGPAMAYTFGNSYGGFVPITYDPNERTLTFDYLYGPSHPGGYTRFAGFEPVEIQLPTLPLVSAVCSSWIDGEDVQACCSVETTSGVIFDAVAVEASDLLFELSGRLFPGECEKTVRPPCVCSCGYQVLSRGHVIGPWGYGYPYDSLCDFCVVACSPSRVKLSGYPVTEITEIKIDGDVVDPTTYRIWNGRYVTRLDNGRWPVQQNLTLADTEDNTFSITYTYGAEPPALGLAAAAQLACEMYKACSTETSGDCALPDGVTKITRQGITIEKQAFTSWGFIGKNNRGFAPGWKTGLSLVDSFLNGYNRQGLLRRPTFWAPGRRQYAQEFG